MIKFKIWTISLLAGLVLLAACGGNKESKNQEPTTQDETLEALNKKIKHHPDDPDLYIQRADYLLGNGSLPEALMSLLMAVDLDSTDAQTWSRLSDVYMLMDNYIESENSMIQALKLDPENEDVLLKLAKYYIIFFDYDDAKIYLDRVLTKNNLNAQAHYLMGNYYLEQGDTSKAVGSFNRSLEIDNNIYDSQIALALLYDSRNNPVAIDYYQNAIRLKPNYVPVQYKLAYYLQEKSGKVEEAERMYDAILEQEPTYYNALFNKGYIFLVYKKDPRTAFDYFSRAAEFSDKKNPDVLYNMAYCLELMDNKKEARKMYKEILSTFPDYKLAIEGQRRVGRFD